MSFMDGP